MSWLLHNPGWGVVILAILGGFGVVFNTFCFFVFVLWCMLF